MITTACTGIGIAPSDAMLVDLEEELLRAARPLDAFTVESLAAAIHGRLAHPLLAPLIGRLVESLASRGWLDRDGDGFRLSERALAELDREPRQLR